MEKNEQKQNETYTHFCLDLDTVRCNPVASPGFPRPASRPAHKHTHTHKHTHEYFTECSMRHVRYLHRPHHPKKAFGICMFVYLCECVFGKGHGSSKGNLDLIWGKEEEVGWEKEESASPD